MADVPISPPAGALTLAGTVTVPLAQGVTFPPATSSINSGFKVPNKGLTTHTMTHTYTVPQLQKNVLTALGYIPAGVTVVGFSIRSDDLDSGGSALVQSLVLGSDTVASGITVGSDGTNGFFPCLPTSVSVPTVLYQKVTTAATTAAAGAVNVTAYYYSS
jgi:hypothetical protein